MGPQPAHQPPFTVTIQNMRRVVRFSSSSSLTIQSSIFIRFSLVLPTPFVFVFISLYLSGPGIWTTDVLRLIIYHISSYPGPHPSFRLISGCISFTLSFCSFVDGFGEELVVVWWKSDQRRTDGRGRIKWKQMKKSCSLFCSSYMYRLGYYSTHWHLFVRIALHWHGLVPYTYT